MITKKDGTTKKEIRYACRVCWHGERGNPAQHFPNYIADRFVPVLDSKSKVFEGESNKNKPYNSEQLSSDEGVLEDGSMWADFAQSEFYAFHAGLD